LLKGDLVQSVKSRNFVAQRLTRFEKSGRPMKPNWNKTYSVTKLPRENVCSLSVIFLRRYFESRVCAVSFSMAQHRQTSPLRLCISRENVHYKRNRTAARTGAVELDEGLRAPTSYKPLTNSTERLPLVDIAPLRAARETWPASVRLSTSVLRLRVFLCDGHGISPALPARLMTLARKFFALPLEQKVAIAMAHGGRAWRGYFL